MNMIIDYINKRGHKIATSVICGMDNKSDPVTAALGRAIIEVSEFNLLHSEADQCVRVVVDMALDPKG